MYHLSLKICKKEYKNNTYAGAGGLWYNFHVGEDYTDHLVCIVFWERLGVGSTGAFLFALAVQ